VAFADNSAQWYALQIIFEFKAPDIVKGEAQLMRYLSNEPMAKMGFWTNGAQTLAIYKRHQADWVRVENAALPHPTDDLTEPPDEPPTWNTLREPTEVELAGALRRLVATVVVSDPHVTRREDQLRELIHVLLVNRRGIRTPFSG
jgi:type I restriction enzyme M protein